MIADPDLPPVGLLTVYPCNLLQLSKLPIFGGRVQPVDAIHELKRSAGVS